jgi:hypothetical protein
MPYNPKHEIFQDVLMAKQLHHNEGEEALKNLNKISNMIGYRREPFEEYASSFEEFLKDNSGCVDAIHNWMAENLTDTQMEDLGWVPGSDEDDEEDEEIKEEDISH